jgi:tetratricopeptide (TPR) repeat protein
MKAALFLALAAAPLYAASADIAVEEGFERGSLGVAAIDRGDWAAAERALMEHRGMRADNPARLINLGKVYMATGRTGLAISTWQQALASDRHFDVATMDGRYLSTREVAARALALHQPKLSTASR